MMDKQGKVIRWLGFGAEGVWSLGFGWGKGQLGLGNPRGGSAGLGL